MKIVRPGEAGYDPNVECNHYARPLDYWDRIVKTDWHLSADKINAPQQESIEKFTVKARQARLINITIRKDGVETVWEGDWIKHIRKAEPTDPKPREFITVTAADYNGGSFDGPPFSGVEGQRWVQQAIGDGRLSVKPDDRDYALWNVKTRHRTVVAEPGDQIHHNADGTLSVLVP
jgi:hypothetical protein